MIEYLIAASEEEVNQKVDALAIKLQPIFPRYSAYGRKSFFRSLLIARSAELQQTASDLVLICWNPSLEERPSGTYGTVTVAPTIAPAPKPASVPQPPTPAAAASLAKEPLATLSFVMQVSSTTIAKSPDRIANAVIGSIFSKKSTSEAEWRLEISCSGVLQSDTDASKDSPKWKKQFSFSGVSPLASLQISIKRNQIAWVTGDLSVAELVKAAQSAAARCDIPIVLTAEDKSLLGKSSALLSFSAISLSAGSIPTLSATPKKASILKTGPRGRNIAPGKECRQSSEDGMWSDGRKASHAVDGCELHMGELYSFITEYEMEPWWQIDLGREVRLSALLIFNQHCAERARTLCVLLSSSEAAWLSNKKHRDWRKVYDSTREAEGSGSADHGSRYVISKPFSVSRGGSHSDLALSLDLTGFTARYVRLQLKEQNYLHLRKVEIYSEDEESQDSALEAK